MRQHLIFIHRENDRLLWAILGDSPPILADILNATQYVRLTRPPDRYHVFCQNCYVPVDVLKVQLDAYLRRLRANPN